MIKFSAICPHPPLIVDKIGTKKDFKIVKNTINAMNYLADEFEKAEIDSVILISPHNLVYNDCFTLFECEKLQGNFEKFGKPDLKLDFLVDQKLTEHIYQKATDEQVPVFKYEYGNIGFLDHGSMVPLYYLTKLVGNNVELVLASYSFLDNQSHTKFGRVIGDICENQLYKDKNIAIIASGDLSHRLFSNEQISHANTGKEFDDMIVKDLKNNNFESIKHYDSEFVESAGECAYRSILILLGALKDKYNCNVLSYEGPYGVGYFVAEFKDK